MAEATRIGEAADRYLVGGVTSGWNSYQVTGRTLVDRARGARVWDVAGTEYIDWIMGWGSLLLGHDPAPVLEAIRGSFDGGFGFQYETEAHGRLAQKICEMVPCAEKVRLANSGTEATLHALRVARRATGRRRIVKFEGHFHGLNDYLLYGVDCGPECGGLRPDGTYEPVAGSQGLPDESLAELVLVLPWNDVDALEEVFRRYGDDVAGVILKPIALNVGCIAPDPGFLAALRAICDRHGALLVFDEILTGFRVAPGGAGELYGVRPDLVCLGKAMGCGMPVAALAGRRDYMELLTPVGRVEMAGTNTGRRMTVLGTLAALEAMSTPGFHDRLRMLNDRAVVGLRELLARYRVPAYVEGWGGRIGVFLGIEERPRTFRDITRSWNREFHVACYREAYYRQGLYGFLLPLTTCPEPVTLSMAHGTELVDETLGRFEAILQAVPYSRAA